VEEIIERHKQELLKHGVQESAGEDEDWGEHQEPGDDPVKEENDSLDNGDLTYITAILESFSRPKSNPEPTSASSHAMFTPESTLTQAPARQMMPPEFNQKFNQTFIGTIFEATSATNFNKTPSANYILL
jgi:hypothetical protein